MNTLGDRIARFRNEKRMSQAKLAQACGWASQSRIGNYEKNLRQPNLDDLQKIARALELSVAELLGSYAVPGSGTPGIAEPTGRYGLTPDATGAVKEGTVPVVGKAQLGDNGYFEAMDFPPGHGDGFLQIHSDDPNAYGLRVVGDSMHPRIKNGEFVLVEPNKPFFSGDEVMVKTRDGRSMIKEFIYLRDGMYRLDSVNAEHGSIHIPEPDVEKIHLVGGILKSSRFVYFTLDD
ncbi:XRE family transcriptional regulator [Pseudomonas indica]|uniref:Phage repressor protein C, contains Cro/C1-type HTH and peptisase s24 domains n=1 Tax=Pseudomonas indica TaxID=137658 RepID=A0A1G8V2Q6_9PSED|nr:XRE family transcriptional regulator [Pseudomonas indica]SDJ60396.1 Phage repressor protein C, contains Cro/C1-type HTH and peptisase s24 domains [Pseudomonas indica]